jgi:hypothetical protein
VSAYFALLSVWIIVFKNAYRFVAVTDRRIVVMQAGRMRLTTIKGVTAELPRSTRLGPPSGLWYKMEALGQTLYVNKRFHKDIEAADALLPSGVAATAG